jgi:hypothetical protein
MSLKEIKVFTANHFAKNPVKGGTPLSERRSRDNIILVARGREFIDLAWENFVILEECSVKNKGIEIKI